MNSGAGQGFREHVRAKDDPVSHLGDALRWRWKLALAIAVLFAVGASAAVETIPPEYDATALVALGPRPDSSAGADTVRVIGPKYVAYATASSTLGAVARVIGEDPRLLQGAISAEIAPDTGNVFIRARMDSSQRAANAANAVAREVRDFSQSDPLLTGELIFSAVPGGGPAAPPRRLYETIAALLGLMFGLGAALVRERSEPRLRSWQEIADVTGYPVVARIPRVRSLRGQSVPELADPVTGSAFRTLRAKLELRLREDNIDVLAVSSPRKGDGKSTTALFLATSLARIGKRVLLVDADMHHPRIAQLTGKSDAAAGLASVLRGSLPLEKAIHQGWREGISLLPTTPDPEAGDLLARRFAQLVADTRDLYDIVLVDTPPVLGTDDALTVASASDGVLLVVAAGTPAALANEAVFAVESLKVPIVGVVANRVRTLESGYYDA